MGVGQTCAAAATFFYDLLVLKTGAYIDVKQDKPFGDIGIMATVGLKRHKGRGGVSTAVRSLTRVGPAS